MMFGSVHHMSTASGCSPTSSAIIQAQQQQQQQHQKMPKVRYGAFFSGMVGDAISREEEEYFAKRKLKKCRQQQKEKENAEQQQQQRRGLSKKLLGKLVRLISVKDFPLLAIVKTFPRDAKKAASNGNGASGNKRRPHNSSQSSTLSGSFEPMPTIEEETDSELLQQLMADAEEASPCCWERREYDDEDEEEISREMAIMISSTYKPSIVQAAA